MTENIHKNHRKRIRETFIFSGAAPMKDHELLELLLFYSVPRADTNATAHKLIERFSSLCAIFEAPVSELKAVDGIGETSAILIKCAFELHKRMLAETKSGDVFLTYNDIGILFTKIFMHEAAEKLYLLLFDKKGRLIRRVLIAEGDLSQTDINTRKILESTISPGIYSAAIGHNHPSGILHPSIEDRTFTMIVSSSLRFSE